MSRNVIIKSLDAQSENLQAHLPVIYRLFWKGCNLRRIMHAWMLLSAFFSFFYLDIHLRSFNDALMSSLLRIHSQYLLLKEHGLILDIYKTQNWQTFFFKSPFYQLLFGLKKSQKYCENTDSSGMLAMNGKCMRLRHGIWHGMATDHISLILLKAHFCTVLASRVDSECWNAAYLTVKATGVNLRLWRFVVMISKCNITLYITTARARPHSDEYLNIPRLIFEAFRSIISKGT